MTTLKERIAKLKNKATQYYPDIYLLDAEDRGRLKGRISGEIETAEEALSIITRQQEAIQIMKEALEKVANPLIQISYYNANSFLQDPRPLAAEALEKTNKILKE